MVASAVPKRLKMNSLPPSARKLRAMRARQASNGLERSEIPVKTGVKIRVF